MNYEQKYKEALENARWKIEHVDCGDENCFNIDDIKDLFSELCESDDERIRKWIINEIKVKHHNLDEDNVDFVDKAIAWLEKQGKLMSVDFTLYNDLKPWDKPRYIINAINEKRVEPVLKGGALHKFKNEFNTLKQILHPLYDYGNPIHYRLALHWASWGAQNLKDCFGMSEKEINKMDDVIGEQKPTEWSEEDELAIERLVDTIEIARSFKYGKPKAVYTDEILDSLINWLKSLTPNHWKPSEEQLTALKNAIIGKRGPLYDLYFDLENL